MKGVAIVDNTVEMDVIRKARDELKELEEMGQVTASKDPCVWAVSFKFLFLGLILCQLIGLIQLHQFDWSNLLFFSLSLRHVFTC